MAKRLTKLYKQMKCKEYSEYNHIWVATVREFNCFEQRRYLYRGCVKCGLNAGVFSSANTSELSLDDKIMKDYIKKNRCNDGIDTTMECDIDLAKAIYSKIKEEYPDIDDETACRYFNAALYKIRKNRVSFEREEDRAVGLSLSPNFNRWSRRHICTD